MRNGQQEAGRHRRRGDLPEHRAAVLPELRAVRRAAGAASDYEHRLAGIRAHNRWLVDWCNEFPERRAGIGQIFLNDIDDAIDDVKWIKENGLRGGILLPNIPPDVKWVKPLYDPDYDRLWEVLPGPRGAGATCTAAPARPTTARTRSRCSSTSRRWASTRSARSCRCSCRACSSASRG